MTILVIDCGNSRIKIGIYQKEMLLRLETVDTALAADLSSVRKAITELLTLAPEGDQILCGVSSVVASLTSPILNLLRVEFKIEAVLVTSSADHGLYIGYSPRESLGADRIADSVAAVHLFSTPCITVNFGTATTINVIETNRTPDEHDPWFMGGAICPGLGMILSAFSTMLPGLGPIEMAYMLSAIGSNTQAAMSSGILYGHVEMVNGLVARMQRERKIAGSLVIATGGHASLVAPYCAAITNIVPDLTLLGIAIIAQRAA